MALTIIKGTIVSAPAPGQLDITEPGYLVAEDGVIRGVYGTLPAEYTGAAVEDFGDCLVLQTFADLHLHAPQYPMVGTGMDLTLLQVPRKVSTDTISGSIHLTLPQDAAFSVELDSASGKLDNEFSSTKTGDIYYCGQGGGTFQFDSVSGDVVIRMAR